MTIAYNHIMKRNIFETYLTLTLILSIVGVTLMALFKFPVMARSSDTDKQIKELRFERISLYLDKTR